jgi:aryl-alcohol dehydrogenase-like predicted oxidoreductase
MKKVKLGELDVSAICMGTDHLGTRVPEETAFAILDKYVAEGGNFVDTANLYATWIEGCHGGESEAMLGRWIKDRGNRDELIIATKMGWPYQDVPMSSSAELIAQEAEKSLERLGIDTIDLYYTHRDDKKVPLEEQMGAMDKLVKAGKVRCLGASNIKAWRLEEARWTSINNGFPQHVGVEQRFTYLRPKVGASFGGQRSTNRDLLEYVRNRDIKLLAYTPLLGGSYDREDKELPKQYQHEDSEVRMEMLKMVAGEVGATLNQTILAWMIQQDIIPIIGASQVAQVEETLVAPEVSLSADQMDRLNKAGVE